MKLVHEENPVVLSNVSTTSEFKIRSTAHSFRILSSGLYSNKIRAIVRELSTNAADSHIQAGIPETPFEVHLPSLLEPWFSVRDYGTGLDYDDVLDIYTTYFCSTKTDSDDYTGALGLGSKSPFAYTENFSVTTIKNGIQNIFSAYISEVGVPSIALLSTNTTNEPNGLEVKFSVLNTSDYRKFRDEAQYTLQWFRVHPTVIGAYTKSVRTYTHESIIPGAHIGDSGPCAVMGNISYPLNNIPNLDILPEDVRAFLRYGVELHFGIGDLEVAASREELSYTPKTIAAIVHKLEQFSSALSAWISDEVDKIDGVWGKTTFLYDKHQSSIYRAAVTGYVSKTAFKYAVTSGTYFSKHTFVYTAPDLLARNLSITAYTVSAGNLRKASVVVNEGILSHAIRMDSDVVFVLDDLTKTSFARLKYHYKSTGFYGTVYLVTSPLPIAERAAHYDTFLSEIMSPPTVLKSSQLRSETKVKRVAPGILQAFRTNSRFCGKDKIPWEECTTLGNASERYYVHLTNVTPCVPQANGKFVTLDLAALTTLIVDSGIPIGNIYGVRKSALATTTEPGWKLLTEKLTEIMVSTPKSEIEDLVLSEYIDSSSRKAYSSKDIAKRLSQDSPYRRFVETRACSTKVYGYSKRKALIALHERFNHTVDVSRMVQSLDDEYKRITERYPLLSDSYAAELDKIHYIKAIDFYEEKKNGISIPNTKG